MAGIEISRRSGNLRRAQIGAATAVLLSLAAGGWTPAAASGPNIVAQWNKIAEDTVVATGAPQIEGFVYMSYTQTAVYDALVGIDGTYQSFGSAVAAPAGASRDAAVVEAASETLAFYIPSAAGPVGAARTTSLAAIPDGQAKTDGLAVGHQAAANIIALQDGRRPPTADRVDVVVPDQDPRAGRVAPDAALPRAADPVGGGHEALRPADCRSLPAAAAAFAVEPRVGRRRRGDQGDGPGHQHAAHRRGDGDREVLDRQRDPPGQPPRPRHRHRPIPRAARHREAGGDDHGDRRGRGHRGAQRQVPLPVLATRDRDRPQLGHGRRIRARARASTMATRPRSSSRAGGRSSSRRTTPSTPRRTAPSPRPSTRC